MAVEETVRYQDITDARSDLSESESQAVREYTGVGSYRLNGALVDGSLDSVDQISAFDHDFSAALAKLPRQGGTVFRGFDRADLARYEPGEIVTENYFVSATTNPDAEFGGAGLWVIESKNGRQIPNDLATVKHESEVVFDHFTQFRVLAKFDIQLAGSNRCLMYMEELD